MIIKLILKGKLVILYVIMEVQRRDKIDDDGTVKGSLVGVNVMFKEDMMWKILGWI